ncbi:MAG: hypothetical protein AYK18_09540 [Theionarchaea archaeon DG-70]|nr:MAG: hypothetical protein AYK18_09540 [Theionarchaea archaeon DG-70]
MFAISFPPFIRLDPRWSENFSHTIFWNISLIEGFNSYTPIPLYTFRLRKPYTDSIGDKKKDFFFIVFLIATTKIVTFINVLL